MIDWIENLPDVQLFIFLSSCFILVSILSILLIQRFIPRDFRHSHNEVIGNVSSLIGLIYGVLSGITALYLINNLSYTTDAVQRESNATANLYRDSRWLKPPTNDYIKDQIVAYLNQVINVEWPLMEAGKTIEINAGFTIDHISSQLGKYSSFTNSEMLILHDMLDEVKALYNARADRIEASYESLNSELWVVILIGTFLMIGINFLFGMNLYMHILTTSASALMASSIIFLLLTLDKPFQGEFVIEPDAFKALLTYINRPPVPEDPAAPAVPVAAPKPA